MLRIPSFGVKLTDLKNGLITREWFRFLEALYLEVQSMNSDFMLNVARGLVSGMRSVNKWGHAPSGMQTTLTDVWDRANATPTQQIWLAPTAARVHALVSTSASDDGSPAGVGARTVIVYGLTSWDTAETTETVTLNGTASVNTVNSYVIIHRMAVATFGASGPNVGTLTATAATDATVTAAILPGNGRTEMAVYGVPSTQTAYLSKFHASINDGAATARVDFYGKVASDPANFPAVFSLARSFCMTNTGTGTYAEEFNPPMAIPGPCILKLSGIASAADIDASGGFDLILIDN
jgi:hypothetical protein